MHLTRGVIIAALLSLSLLAGSVAGFLFSPIFGLAALSVLSLIVALVVLTQTEE